MSVNFNNSKGDSNLALSILEAQSIFWWTGKKEGDLIGVQSPHLDTS